MSYACFERKDLLKTAYFKVLTVINFTVPASSIRSFWSRLKKSVLHFMPSQKYSINEHVPRSGRAASLPERITERRKAEKAII